MEVARSPLARDTRPTVSEDDRATFAADQASFATELLHAVVAAAPEDDVFVSPHSVSSALAMTYAGARGETAAEMRKALHFTLPDERLHAAFNATDLALDARSGDGVSIHVLNALFGQKGYAFHAPFLDTLAVSYGAGMNLLDFRSEPEPARSTINRWVKQETNDKIKDLLPEQSIESTTRLVLVNAVHIDADWATPFKEEATSPATFTKLDGQTATVSMMRQTSSFAYAKGDGYQAVALPYEGGALEMLVVLPAEGTFRAFESALTGDKLGAIVDSLSPEPVVLSLPKVKLESSVKLKPALQSLGMNLAFSDADFTGIADGALKISNAFHKTYVAIDEEGTEAAAASAVVIGRKGADMPEEQAVMTIDRPYIAALMDKPTHTILFLGRIVAPKE